MKKIFMTVAAFCTLMVAPSLAEAAVRGISTANVNMRSGPSTSYPAVLVIPEGSRVTINGCMSSVNWCDVTYAGGRGWVYGRYVQATYGSNRVYVEPDYYRRLDIPIVTFDLGTYWGRYYRNRDFYRERDRWRRYDWRSQRPAPPLPPRWDGNRDRDWGDRRPVPPPPGWNRDRDRNWDDRPRRVEPPRFDRDDVGRPPLFERDRNRNRDDGNRWGPPRFDRDEGRRPSFQRGDQGQRGEGRQQSREERRAPPRERATDSQRCIAGTSECFPSR